MNADLPPNLEELPAEGVVSCFEAKTFLHLVLLCHSVRETYPVPVVCFDAGLSADQRAWIAENLPSCTVLSVPEGAAPSSDGSLRGPLIAASPFRRTCWVDPGLILLSGIGELFTRLDYGPVVVGDAAVSGLDAERDAALLELPNAPDDPAPGEGPWTIPLVPSEALPGACFRDVDEFFEELRRALPDVHAVRLSGEWPELDPLLLSVAARTPGNTWPRSSGQRSAVSLMSMIAAKSSPELVEAFLDHYYRLGVESFLIALHSETGDPRSDRILQILRRYEIEPMLVTPVFSAAKKLRFYEQAARERCSPQDWVLYADVDELQVFPAPLAEVLEACDKLGYTFVRGELLDRVAGGGELIEIEPRPPVWEQFPFTAFVTSRLTAGWTGKVCAAKGWVRLGEGGAHTLDYGSDDPRNYIRTQRDPRRYPRSVEVHHFKWDAALARRAYEKVHALGGDLDSVDGPEFMPEYTALLEHLDRFGRLAIDDLTFAGTPNLHYVRASLAGLSLSPEVSQGQTPMVEGAGRASPKRSLRSSPHPGPAPDRSYLLCTSPRTGSNLLCELLSRTGEAGFPGEYFFEGGEEINCRWWGIEPGHAYLEEVVRRSTSENGVVGTKVMWPHVATLLARLRAAADTPEATDVEALAYLLPSPRFIWLRREDTIAQAVSWARAVQTGQWLPQQKPANKPVFDYELIRFFAGRASAFEDEWRRWFERHEIAPLRISHEELLADVGGSIGRILEFLEIPVPADLSAGSELTSRQQRDEVNCEWTKRYCEVEPRPSRRARTAPLADARPADPRAVHACTVITRNRLAHARVLTRSFLEHHPGGRVTALVLDDLGREVAGEPFYIVHPEDVGLDRKAFSRMALSYGPRQLACATKPWVIKKALGGDTATVAYLDSDIEVFGSLEEAVRLASAHSIVLTPHLTEPPPRPPLSHEEEARLVGGVFNAGFLAVDRSAIRFLDWWQERLALEGTEEPERGYYDDQRWLDLVPAYFDHYVLRDPGYNVASWNLLNRRLESSNSGYRVDGVPLRFFHFGGFDAEAPHIISRWQRPKPTVLLSENPALERLCQEYSRKLLEQGYETCRSIPYGFQSLPNGVRIDQRMRELYRQAALAAERDDKPEPPNPFVDGVEPFFVWLNAPADGPGASKTVSRYLASLYEERPDLQMRFPDIAGADARGYLEWTRAEGTSAEGIPVELLPKPRQERHSAQGEAMELRQGINLVSRAATDRPLDEMAEQIAAALEAAGIEHQRLTWRHDADPGEDPFDERHPASAAYDTNLVCLAPIDLGSFAFHVDAEFFRRRPSIGFWFDEEVPSPQLSHALSFLDEVWVPSSYAAEGLRARTVKEVSTLPLPVRPAENLRAAQELNSMPTGFRFLSFADFGGPFSPGVLERANPFGPVEAFSKAFSEADAACLLVRTTNGQERLDELERLRLMVHNANVRILDGPLSAEERKALVAACDCLISLHRCEEFGLPLAEATMSGTPVVATGFSGNLEFMREDTSYLVPASLSPMPERFQRYWSGQEWADPDLGHAARLFRHVYEHADEARRKGEQARKAFAEQASLEVVADFVSARLTEARRRLARKKDDTFEAPPPVDPFQRAERYVFQGPANRWDAASRFGFFGSLGRRALLRVLRPYTARRGELDATLVDALRELRARQDELEAGIRNSADDTGELRSALARDLRRLNRLERVLPRLIALWDPSVGSEDQGEPTPGLVRLHRTLELAGMTTHEERAYCHWYAREQYTGQGDVVELGCWLGALTVPLAMGLAENRRETVENRRIHAFDRFVWEPWMDEHAAVVGTDIEGQYVSGESFRAEFDAHIAPWRGRVEVHEGNLLELAWHGGDIEFLLVDAMKSWELARSTLRDFFPRLIPRLSLVMHQDFSHYYTYWIHLLMHRFRDHFEVACEVPASTSVVFRLRDEIPDALLTEGYSPSSFSLDEIEEAFQYSLALVTPAQAPNIAAAKIFALIEKGDLDRARRELERWSRLGGSPKSELTQVAGLLGQRLARGEDGHDRGAA